MAILHHQVWIDAPIEKVYDAISTAQGVSTWWDQQTEKRVEGDLIWEHSPPPTGGTTAIGLKVVERVAGKNVVLTCAYAPEDGTAMEDWIGTTLTFEVQERTESNVANRDWMNKIPAKTVLNFTHSGWDEGADYFAFCNSSWGAILANLKSVCEETA